MRPLRAFAMQSDTADAERMDVGRISLEKMGGVWLKMTIFGECYC